MSTRQAGKDGPDVCWVTPAQARIYTGGRSNATVQYCELPYTDI